MKKKKGFTLLELMVTLSILLILSVMISAILIQSQRILVGVDNNSKIQDEVRTALLKIQTNAQKADKIIVSDKYAVINSNKWELSDNKTSARELLRIIDDKDKDIAKVYAEVNYEDKHQLVEFDINELTHEIINSSKNVLISKIDGEGVDTIDVKLERVIDSNGNTDEFVTINCSKIAKGNKVNENDYLISFNNKGKNEINIEIEGSSGNNNGNNSGDNTNLGGSGSFDVSFNVINDDESKSGWIIKIENKTGKDVQIESVSFNFAKIIVECDNGEFSRLENGKWEIRNISSSLIKKGDSLYIGGKSEGKISEEKIYNIEIKMK